MAENSTTTNEKQTVVTVSAPTPKPINYIYIGPNLKEAGLITNTIMYGGIPDSIASYIDEKAPHLRILIIPTADYAKVAPNIDVKGTPQYEAFHKEVK
ncbi:hypothetical protein [uncultured Veillonella sp.]|uniref:hypothetical protein n=1 Tax=uncultured Veillonella sp. TaxID=159268 RepID=UPI0025966BC3|nr:hypothetical protein [uncultured Veillonella sp.]